MIVLFTDFGARDPYVGLVKARLAEHAPALQVVDLLNEVPDFNPHAGAHLLAAFADGFPPGSVFLAVVDPGVGTPRDAVVMMAGGRWFVGPEMACCLSLPHAMPISACGVLFGGLRYCHPLFTGVTCSR